MTPQSRTRTAVVLALAFIAAIAICWALAVWLSGGLAFTAIGVRISSSDPVRPILIALVGTAAIVGIQGLRRTREIALGVTATHTAIAMAIATVITSLAGNSWTASGPDSYAYVSQAELWRTGRLSIPVPLAAEAPWPDAITTFMPFGYRPAANRAPELVPVTAAGVPILMAALQKIGGHCAAFVLTPIAGAALVLLTYAVGRRVRSARAGLIAAWLVATSPAVLFMLMWPMTDIPAAACTALVIWLALKPSPSSSLAAGLAAAAGVLIRANLALIAAGVLAWLALESVVWRNERPSTFARGALSEVEGRGRWRRPMAFLIGLLPGMMLTMWLNARWYGSPVASGYGAAGDLFSAGHVATNLLRYARWLAETSPLALAGVAALAIPAARLWANRDGDRRVWLLLALTAAATIGIYLLYEPYTAWWYLRFLLPAWPALFVAAAVVFDAASERGRHVRAAVVAIVLIAGVASVAMAYRRGVFHLGERRYATIARLVDAHTEPHAVILTVQHSGTVRYYAGRETLRFDLLDHKWLDRAIDWLHARGRHPYVLVEDWEHPQFEQRFAETNARGRLSYTPALAWQSSGTLGWVFLYDPIRGGGSTIQPGPEVERRQPWCAPAAQIRH